jgi:hypothetical protein
MACGAPSNQEIAAKSEGQFVKIELSQPGAIDSLLAKGVDVLVAADDYAIIRTDANSISTLSAAGVKTYAASEGDFIQRLVHISISEKNDVQKIADLGVDIWEVQENVVVAQAYDKHIRQLQEIGLEVEVVADNSQTTVEK